MGFTVPCAHQLQMSLTNTVSVAHLLGQKLCTCTQIQELKALMQFSQCCLDQWIQVEVKKAIVLET